MQCLDASLPRMRKLHLHLVGYDVVDSSVLTNGTHHCGGILTGLRRHGALVVCGVSRLGPNTLAISRALHNYFAPGVIFELDF